MADHDETWDGPESRKNQAGFAVNSWSSLMSLLYVCIMAVGGISWGLKLETRIDKYADLQTSMRERFLADIATTQAILSKGMLPVTEVKIQNIENKLIHLEADIDECLRKKRISDPPSRTSVRASNMPPVVGDTTGPDVWRKLRHD